jgi:hypothetical protein
MIEPEARAEFAALQKEEASFQGTQAERDAREMRMRALWQHHGEAWLKEDLDLGLDRFFAGHVVYRDGYPHTVELSLAEALERRDKLGALPIHALRLTAIDRGIQALAQSTALDRVKSLDLGYGLEKLGQDDLVHLLRSRTLGNLEELAFSPHEDVPAVWRALESFPRLAALKKLGLQQIVVSPDRARWLARSLPSLERLDCDRSLTGASLEVLAESATFKLKSFVLWDSDGLHGRVRLLGDLPISRALGAPVFADLTLLSLFGCHIGEHTAAVLAALPCSPSLERLNLGSQGSSRVVRALPDCTFPRLKSLNIRHNELNDFHVDFLARFPGLETLRLEKNRLGPRTVHHITSSLPLLRELDICDSAVGNAGALELALCAPASLRGLELSSSGLTAEGVARLVESPRLADLRELDVACNELGKPGVRLLADGGLDKMARLSVGWTMRGDMDPLFEEAWLRCRDGFGGSWYERKLEASGAPVPRAPRQAKPKGASKPRAVLPEDLPALDPGVTYHIGQRVRHPEHGPGVVSNVHPLFVEVKYPSIGASKFALLPTGTVPYEITRKYETGDLVLHPKFGAGIVGMTGVDRIEVDFGAFGRKTMLHAKKSPE